MSVRRVVLLYNPRAGSLRRDRWRRRVDRCQAELVCPVAPVSVLAPDFATSLTALDVDGNESAHSNEVLKSAN